MKKALLLAAPFAILSAQEIAQDVVFQARPGLNNTQVRQMKLDAEQRAVEFISVEMGSSGVVKNSPYSAEAVTETVQMLADGNKITRKNSVTQYRDSEGRTRREFELQSFGRLGDVEANANKTVTIDDPVAKMHYSLNLQSKTAMKMPRGEGGFSMAIPAPVIGGVAMSGSARAGAVAMAAPTLDVAVEPGQPAMVTRSFERVPMPPGGAGPSSTFAYTTATSVPAFQVMSDGKKDAKEEDLGSRNIEGVEAKGRRSTFTIAAGEVGNEREINVVSEKWYSDQLKTYVMTKHSDPRFGETTLRLNNVRLGEPPATLFDVPADFTVQEPQMRMAMPMRKRAQE